jgi:hypothetical protein
MTPKELVQNWVNSRNTLRVRTMISAQDLPCLVVEDVDGNRAVVLEFDGKDTVWAEALPRKGLPCQK